MIKVFKLYWFLKIDLTLDPFALKMPARRGCVLSEPILAFFIHCSLCLFCPDCLHTCLTPWPYQAQYYSFFPNDCDDKQYILALYFWLLALGCSTNSVISNCSKSCQSKLVPFTFYCTFLNLLCMIYQCMLFLLNKMLLCFPFWSLSEMFGVFFVNQFPNSYLGYY